LKCAILKTLIQLAKTICDEHSLDLLISQLTRTFRHNGYSNFQTMCSFGPK
jgi:hypothetical protein